MVPVWCSGRKNLHGSSERGRSGVSEGTPGAPHGRPAAKLGSLYSLLSQLEAQEWSCGISFPLHWLPSEF